MQKIFSLYGIYQHNSAQERKREKRSSQFTETHLDNLPNICLKIKQNLNFQLCKVLKFMPLRFYWNKILTTNTGPLKGWKSKGEYNIHPVVSAHGDKHYNPNVTAIFPLKPLSDPLIQKSLNQSILNPISDLKTSSVTQYFPRDMPSSHPPHTTTGFKAPAQRMWQESKKPLLLLKSEAGT